jgi:hypothetical protein
MWISHEIHRNFVWNSHKFHVNLTEIHINFTWNIHEFHVKFTCISREIHMFHVKLAWKNYFNFMWKVSVDAQWRIQEFLNGGAVKGRGSEGCLEAPSWSRGGGPGGETPGNWPILTCNRCFFLNRYKIYSRYSILFDEYEIHLTSETWFLIFSRVRSTS